MKESVLKGLKNQERLMIQNSMKSLTLDNIDFMRNLLELHNKAFHMSPGNIFEANQSSIHPTIA
jgi:hypothetical protein